MPARKARCIIYLSAIIVLEHTNIFKFCIFNHFMSNLAHVLEPHRISIQDVPVERIQANNPREFREIKGRIPEALVGMWLEACPDVELDTDFPRRANGFYLEQRPTGILVREGNKKGKQKTEFDYLMLHGTTPYVVEVKAQSLHGGKQLVDKLLRKAKHIYPGQDVRMLLFLRFAAFNEKRRTALQSHYPQVEFVDLGYSSQQLTSAVKAYLRRQQPREQHPQRHRQLDTYH
jgi:hypothetical protein